MECVSAEAGPADNVLCTSTVSGIDFDAFSQSHHRPRLGEPETAQYQRTVSVGGERVPSQLIAGGRGARPLPVSLPDAYLEEPVLTEGLT